MRKEKKIIVILMLLILVVGFFLRFYKIGEKSFAVDEFLDVNSIYGYYQTGIWHAWDFNIEAPSTEDVYEARDERSIVYRWQVVQMLRILPLNEITARLVSIFWGMLSVLAIYFAGAYFSGKKQIGILSAFLLAVNISAIQADRTLRMYAMFIPVFLFLSWSLFKFIEEKYTGNNNIFKKINRLTGLNVIWFFPVLFFFLLSLQTHELTVNMAFVVISYLLIQAYFFIKKNKNLRNKYVFLIVNILLAGGFLYLIFQKFIENKLGNLEFFMTNFSYFSKIAIDYNSYLLAIAFIFFGIYFSIKEESLKSKTIWVATCYLTILLLAVFLWHHKPSERYLYFIKPFEIILLSIGIYRIAIILKEKMATNKNIFAIALIFSLALIPNFTYFINNNYEYKKSFLRNEMNYKKVYAFVSENISKEGILITRRGRNYYWRGQNIRVYPIVTDTNRTALSLEKLQEIISNNSSGWIVISNDDKKYIKKSALKYMEINLEKIEIEGMGDGIVYRW